MFKNSSTAVRGILLGLLVIALTLSIACRDGSTPNPLSEPGVTNPAVVTPSVTASPTPAAESTWVYQHPQYPCGPTWIPELGGRLHQHFLHWTRDGSQLVFDFSEAVWTVDVGGTRIRQIVDSDPGRGDYASLESNYGFYADVSPDGAWIVYSTCEFPMVNPSLVEDPDPRAKLGYEIAVADIDGASQMRLTSNATFEHYPTWSPDGRKIAYLANEYRLRYNGFSQLFTVHVDGSGVPENLTMPIWNVASPIQLALYPPVWSPDSKWIAFTAVTEDVKRSYQGRFLYTIRADGTELTRLGDTTTLPSWKPDGSELAYGGPGPDGVVSAIYSVKPDGSDRRTTWTDESDSASVGIHQVSWSTTGSELLFISNHVYTIDSNGEHRRQVSRATQNQYDGRYSQNTVATWSPDGSRMAVYHPGEEIVIIARDGSETRVLVEIAKTQYPIIPEGGR